MRCIAIDDEPIALSIVSNFCQKLGGIELSTYTHPLDGVAAIGELRPDLVFLDIEMNDYSGLDIARELPEGTLLIFTTAHASYALDSYEVNAVDFLHKPFSFDRFASAVERARQIAEILSKANSTAAEAAQTITIKVDYQNVTIDIADVIYVEAMDNYIKINFADRRTIVTKMSIKCFMELLPKRAFLRIHRSFVVSKAAIASYTKQQVSLLSDMSITLPVGRNYAESLYLEMLNQN
ncbi:MAG: LytTR family DNA-binding domain-containing protein [Rikenellaceae bacterium]